MRIESTFSDVIYTIILLISINYQHLWEFVSQWLTRDASYILICRDAWDVFNFKVYLSHVTYQVEDLQNIREGLVHLMMLERHRKRVEQNAQRNERFKGRVVHDGSHLKLKFATRSEFNVLLVLPFIFLGDLNSAWFLISQYIFFFYYIFLVKRSGLRLPVKWISGRSFPEFGERLSLQLDKNGP